MTQQRKQRELDAQLFSAVRKDDLAKLRLLLAAGANPSAIEVRTRQILYFGHIKGACDSALITAARRGTLASRAIIEELIKAGADIAYENNWGETARSTLLKHIEELRAARIDTVLLRVLLSSLTVRQASASES